MPRWYAECVRIVGGGVGEWLKPAVVKTVRPERVSGVRIPPPPPVFCILKAFDSKFQLSVRLSLGQAGVIARTHPCHARLHWKYPEYVFLPQNRLDGGDLDLHPCHLLHRVSVVETRLGVSYHLRQSRAVHRAAPGQCRLAPECRHAALAAESLLDADRPEQHSLDDRPVSVDLPRGLPSQTSPRPEYRRYSVLPARHPHDGGARAPSASPARRNPIALRLPGFRAPAHLVDVPLCLYGLAVDICLADGCPIQLQLQSAGQHSEHGHRRRSRGPMADVRRPLADRVRQSLWRRNALL